MNQRRQKLKWRHFTDFYQEPLITIISYCLVTFYASILGELTFSSRSHWVNQPQCLVQFDHRSDRHLIIFSLKAEQILERLES